MREAPFVVFVIGMRIDALWKARRWAPVAAAMPRMIGEPWRHRAVDAGRRRAGGRGRAHEGGCRVKVSLPAKRR